MTAAGIMPKVDGDVYFSQDVNNLEEKRFNSIDNQNWGRQRVNFLPLMLNNNIVGNYTLWEDLQQWKYPTAGSGYVNTKRQAQTPINLGLYTSKSGSVIQSWLMETKNKSVVTGVAVVADYKIYEVFDSFNGGSVNAALWSSYNGSCANTSDLVDGSLVIGVGGSVTSLAAVITDTYPLAITITANALTFDLLDGGTSRETVTGNGLTETIKYFPKMGSVIRNEEQVVTTAFVKVYSGPYASGVSLRFNQNNTISLLARENRTIAGSVKISVSADAGSNFTTCANGSYTALGTSGSILQVKFDPYLTGGSEIFMLYGYTMYYY